MNKTQFDSLSTRALYAEPKCETFNLAVESVLCASDGNPDFNDKGEQDPFA